MTDEVGSGTLAGRQIAGYQVLALLGAGGMGEVYRARDTRLGREVALKVLLRDRAADPAQQARFRREAQAASALNHPNILAVYDVGVEDGISFIITELVDGTSLREEVARGPLPIKRLLDLATQIAEGLATAHEAGIVHRDLKPENLMVTRDGRAKILDFGLALAPLPTAPSDAGTLHVTRTETGLMQGTIPYMSPEQARGEAGDFRSDQFSFGLMLYEMTTGMRAFQRETPVQTLSAIITDEAPPISGLTSRAPARLQWLIERCLAKDPIQRYAATRDLAQDLRAHRDRPGETTAIAAAVPDTARRRSAGRILILVAATIATLAVGIDVWLRLRPTDLGPSRQFVVPPPKGATFPQSSAFMTVSPDGQSLAFVASSPEGNNTLWVQGLDSPTPRQLLRTEGAGQPYWSPDSRFVAFGVKGKTKKIEVSSGILETLEESVGSGTWNADGIIVGPRAGKGLYQISAAGRGGSATPVTTLDLSRKETGHMWPYFLPDGRHFLYLAVSEDADHDGILYVGSLDSPERTTVFSTPVDSNVVYAAGYLFYMQTTTLFAVAFDADSLSLKGTAVPIATNIDRTSGTRRGAFSVSQAGGVLAYRLIGETQLAWFDRGGRMIELVGANALYGNPTLSPDEHTVAVNRRDPATGTADIWLINRSRGVPLPFTIDPSEDPSDELKPLWFLNGNRLVFGSNRKPRPSPPSGPGFYGKTLNDAGPGDLLLSGVHAFASPLGWCRDGSLLYQARAPLTGQDLWTLSLTGDRTRVPVLQTQADETQGQLSRDGRWMAYVSNRTQTQEVYVMAFPDGRRFWQVSTQGGIEPHWGDGTELFYLAPDRSLMSVAMKDFPDVDPGIPEPLFKSRMSPVVDHAYTRNQYVVTKDGQRFLINQPADGESASSITVVLNWTARLKR
jgi:serine/threonine protein kinase